MFMSNIFRRSL